MYILFIDRIAKNLVDQQLKMKNIQCIMEMINEKEITSTF